MLAREKGMPISGEHIAGALNVSRNSVWKAINALKEAGYPICSANKGYSLATDTDVLTPSLISDLLPEALRTRLLIDFEECVSSTNDMLKLAARKGAAEGSILIARRQTAGKGRLGRTFESPESTGLYMSILLRPTIPLNESLLITTAAAAAAAETAEALTGEAAQIKWVNDVFVGGKKVCGILTEGAADIESGGLEYAVLGIGMNISAPKGGFDAEIAGALFSSPLAGRTAKAAAEIITRFFAYYDDISKKPFLEAYRSRSMVTGKDVNVITPRGSYPARVLAVEEDFSLRIRTENGNEELLRSGEVSVRL